MNNILFYQIKKLERERENKIKIENFALSSIYLSKKEMEKLDWSFSLFHIIWESEKLKWISGIVTPQIWEYHSLQRRVNFIHFMIFFIQISLVVKNGCINENNGWEWLEKVK